MKLNKSLGFFKKRPVLVLCSGLITSVILFAVMNLWKADLNYAFSGGSGDAALELMGIKNLIETGSRNLSDRLGGLFGQKLYDYPVSDALNYGIMWVISLFTDKAAVVLNVFYLMTYPLAAMSAMWVAMELGISSKLSMVVSLLFPFMSYHFIRGESHLLLSAYYMIPFGLLLAFWVLQDEVTCSFHRRDSLWKNIRENRKFLLAILLCLMISSTGLYYAYFTCFFISMALIKQVFAARRWNKNTTTGALMLTSIAFGVLMNYMPTFFYHWNGGEHAAALLRPKESATVYGLKLIDLFIPQVYERLDFVRDLVTKFHSAEPLSNENVMVSLGVFGSVGFALLMILPVVCFKKNTLRVRLMKNASYFAYTGVLLATIGGVSSMISWFITSSIRAYNRICVFLFFLALISLAVFMETVIYGRAEDPELRSSGPAPSKPVCLPVRIFRKYRKILVLGLIPVLLLALLDQVPFNSVPSYEANKQADQKIQAYFAECEASVPSGTAVYQLPYVAFPEPVLSYGSGPYAQLAGYLNTRTLRWSYGALAGTSADKWAQAVSMMSAEDMLTEIKKAGYGAIYIDFQNYPEEQKATADELISLSGGTPVISEDGQRVFISLQG